jgi:glycerol-3-phosphate dehydrogenase (NAD(P)+)
VHAIYTSMAPHLAAGQVIVSATKGIVTSGDTGTYQRVTEVIAAALHAHRLSLPCAVLSGPSFAQEVAAGQPTAMTIACLDTTLAARLQEELSGPALRLYTNDDVVGVELGGALKNVIAIATGIVGGLGLGHNSAAALITRGIAEITRLAVACGGRRETMAGLAGLGDLVLTCTGELSRNRRVGFELGKGRRLSDILNGMGGKVAEGVLTTRAALGLATAHGIEMPITTQVDAILHRGKSPREAVAELMRRPGRDEL